MGNGLCGANGLFGNNPPANSATAAARADQDSPQTQRHVPAAAAASTQQPNEPAEARFADSQPHLTPPTPPQQPAAPVAGAGHVRRMSTTPADRKAAEELKVQGNTLFAKARYSAAIERYTEAITLSPEWALLYVNRGMAARKRGEWERVEADATMVLSLGASMRETMKGHYLLGLARAAKGQHDKSTQHLRKALDAAREANDSIKDEIWRELATANYKNWAAESTARRQQHAAMRQQLASLLAQSSGAHSKTTGQASADMDTGPGGGAAQLPAEWAALFQAASRQDVATEAPSQFTCPLTMEIFRDPVLVPSGRSYERSVLLEHLKKVGCFDPITRQPLSEEQMLPNVSLRAAIELYLEEHPWAWAEVK